jgi:GNAT superfamily N-acetyltransferase
MASLVKVRVLHGVPMERLEHLIDESQREGFEFLVRMRDEWNSGRVRFDGQDEAFFVAELDGEILGVCGLTPDPVEDDNGVGRVRRLYVSRAHRRQGIGAQLVRRLCDMARGHFRELRVKAPAPAGHAFYESLGFQEAGPGESYTHYVDLAEV